jgi:hypothetical protein
MSIRCVVAFLWAVGACRSAGSGPHGATLPQAVVPEECRLTFESETEENRRFLASLEADCRPLGRCILACVASGCPSNVGGGCAHLCSNGPWGDEGYIRLASSYLRARKTGSCP